MTPQLEALAEVARYLESKGVPYATIGGLAASVWGRPRATQDADLTVLVPLEEERSFLEDLVRVFPGRIPDAIDFARKSRVALLTASNGIPLDVALGIPGYQEEMIKRAVSTEFDRGVSVQVCSAEDLIIHKAVAGRGQDRQDILGILERRSKLDLEYVRKWLAEFDEALGVNDATDTFQTVLAQYKAGSQ